MARYRWICQRDSSPSRSRLAWIAVGFSLVIAHIAAVAGATEWQSAALWGADVRSLVYSPLRPDLALAGTASGQVYRSDDGGSTWKSAGAALPFPGWVVGTLAFDPDRPQRLWAGLRGVFGGGMVAWSEDYGTHWAVPHAEHSLAEQPIYALAPVPGRPGRLFAGSRAGVLHSEDDGATWRLVSGALASLINVSSLWVDPARPDTVIAGTFRRAYRSEDGGETWSPVFAGMVEDTEVFSLHAVSGQPGSLWASTCGWVYQTGDRGAKWQRRSAGLAERRTPSFAVLGGERLLAGTVAGAYLSTDGGTAWVRSSDPDLAILAIAHHPARPLRVLLGTEGAGVWRSDDGGHHFRAAISGLRNMRVAATALHSGLVWAAVNHAGPASGLYRSADGGLTFERAFGGLPTVLELAASRDALWAATERGLFRFDAATLSGRSGPSGRFAGAAGAPTPLVDFGDRRVDQIEADPESARVVARATGEVYERIDGRFRRIHARAGRAGASVAPIASIALAGGALWASDGDGLVRLADQERRAVAAPEESGHLEAAGRGIALNGGEFAWVRADLASPWQEIAGGHPRILPTSDARWPLVVIGGDAASTGQARLGEATAGGWSWRPIALPVPARDVLSALVVGDRLLLATSGYGVLGRSIAR